MSLTGVNPRVDRLGLLAKGLAMRWLDDGMSIACR
jgi:hypothetical protein